MADPIERYDLGLCPPVDANALVDELLNRIDFKSAGFDSVVLLPRVTAYVDSYAMDHDVVIWHSGEPEQPDANLKAWVWRFTLDLTIVNRDPERNYRLAKLLHREISRWPYAAETASGKVGTILDNPMFALNATGDVVTSKTAVIRSCTKLIQAGCKPDLS